MTKVDGPWRRRAPTQRICALLTDAGARALFVGGCVRNALLGVPVSDIDIATDALPQRVMELARAAGVKAIPTGLDHGTVTLVQGGIPHEVTTFRRDIGTDGRRATVAFSTRIDEDAARRDFTMNALYARPDGTVLDPIGGLSDLAARRLRFIGSAEARIREDNLRSLRFFRFHAWYGDPAEGMDPEAIAAIAANLDGTAHVSAERITAELLKLLNAPDPAPAVAGMRSSGLLARLLPGADDRFLAPLIHLEADAGVAPEPIRRLAALGGQGNLRLSRAQVARLGGLREGIGLAAGPAELGYRRGGPEAVDILLLRAALSGQPWVNEDRKQALTGANSRFPLGAKDLMPTFSGPALGARLAELEAAWIASGFALGAADLLALPPKSAPKG